MSTLDAHPRTLVVGGHISEFSGTGIYLRMLFTEWPKDRLACVSGSSLPPDWTRCSHYYQTGDQEFKLQLPLNWIVPTRWSGPLENPIHRQGANAQLSLRSNFVRRVARYFWQNVIRPSGGESLYYVTPSVQLLAWIKEVNPGVIYGHCSDLSSVRFLRRIHQALGLPLVLHLMDDWAGTLYQTMGLTRCLRSRYQVEFAELVQSATIVLGICPEMAEAYEQRYQRPVLSLPNPVEMKPYQKFTRTKWTSGKPFRLRYGGRIGWAIRNSLVDISKVVMEMRHMGVDVVFDITTFNPEQVPDACRNLSGVTVSSPCSLVDLPRVQSETDVLVVCYDFDPKSIRLARYSMPGKMAECMASGTPVLVYGPAGLPVVEYARRFKWGHVVDTQNQEVLSTAIRKLVKSESLREQLGRTAIRLVAERHDASQVAQRFRELVLNAQHPVAT